MGLLIVIAGIAVAFFLWPRPVRPLDELLARLVAIHDDAKLTGVQKLQQAHSAYRHYESSIVSLIGGVHDVFPNNSIVLKTTIRDLPLIGVELSNATKEQLLHFEKGKPATLRARLPGWAAYTDVVGLAAGFHDCRLFYSGKWFGVKSTYRVRDPSEPKTGEFKAAPPKTGEFKAAPPKTGEFKVAAMKTGEFKAISTKTGEFRALPPKTGEFKAVPPPKTGEFRVAPLKTGDKTGEFKALPVEDDPKRKQ